MGKGISPSAVSEDELPDDPQLLRQIIQQKNREIEHHRSTIQEQHETIHALKQSDQQKTHRIQELVRKLYGPRSERIDPSQLTLFHLGEEQGESSSDEEAQEEVEEKRTRKRKKPRRRRIPDELPWPRIVHELPEAELPCPCCGEQRQAFGKQVTEQVEYIPETLVALQHVQKKYHCKQCEGQVATAEKPHQPIDRGLPGPGLLAQIVVSKYGDHQPLYRLERITRRQGLELARSTTCGWSQAAAQIAYPLYELLVSLALSSKVLHTDDTEVQVQEKGRGRTRRGQVWVYVGDAEHPYTVYDFTGDRSRDGPARFLRCFSGYLQADAYAGYDQIYAQGTEAGPVTEVACWAHARRYFHEARQENPARAHAAKGWIRQLYQIESEAESMDAEARRQLRQQKAKPILDELHAYLNKQKEDVLPKSPMGKASHYALSNWTALNRYLEDGDLAIDNNAAENALRQIALGRKNWLFAGNDAGGQTAAILFTLIKSAERHGLDPFAYFREVLD
jgi:transposase